jgi:hypothetical protein
MTVLLKGFDMDWDVQQTAVGRRITISLSEPEYLTLTQQIEGSYGQLAKPELDPSDQTEVFEVQIHLVRD